MTRALTAGAVLVVAFVVLCATHVTGQVYKEMTDAEQAAIIRGLTWHYKWKTAAGEVPVLVSCRGLRFSDGERAAVCSPGSIQVTVTTVSTCPGLHVESVTSGPASVENALDFRKRLKEGSNQAVVAEIRTDIPRNRLRSHDTDGQVSAQFMGRVENWAQSRSGVYGGKVQLLFPRARSDDPLYHVYELIDDELRAVHEFTVECGEVADFPHWSFDLPHKSLPNGSQERVGDETLWYRSIRY